MHKNCASCPSCKEKLRNSNIIISNWFINFVLPYFPDCHISWSFRGEQQQNELFASGKTMRKWPDSKHNKTDAFKNPCAEALDLFQLFKDEKTAIFDTGYFKSIFDKSQELGQNVKWAGNWQHFREYDHFEIDSPEIPSPNSVTPSPKGDPNGIH